MNIYFLFANVNVTSLLQDTTKKKKKRDPVFLSAGAVSWPTCLPSAGHYFLARRVRLRVFFWDFFKAVFLLPAVVL